MSRQLLQMVKLNEKFMRSLTQFNQILSLKKQRKLPAPTSGKQSQLLRKKPSTHDLLEAPETPNQPTDRLLEFLKKDEAKQNKMRESKSQKNIMPAGVK